jgi:hypothetical protein
MSARFLAIFVMALGLFGGASAGEGHVLDAFGRDVTKRGIELTDWEGEIANPALQFVLKAPDGFDFPAKAIVRAEERIYFNLPSMMESNRSVKTVPLRNAESESSFLISIFPDRDGEDEDHELQVTFVSASGEVRKLTVPVHVHDEDRPRAILFKILLDPSRDTTGFFTNKEALRLTREVADDWAYFIDAMPFDRVPVGAEPIYIWNPDGFFRGHEITNDRGYRGFLLYIYGIAGPELRSGGEGSYQGRVQRTNGVPIGLKRSGAFEVETQGNYNRLRWFFSRGDEDFSRTMNLRHQTNDYASIAHHEIGHAIGFNFNHPSFQAATNAGGITSTALEAYLGRKVPIDESAHFTGLIDPASRRGAFGYDYYGEMPKFRWLITKTDVLALGALGYKLRDTTPLKALAVHNSTPVTGIRNGAYKHDFEISGGVRPYFVEITRGKLPDGLQIDSFSGEISGTPAECGEFKFTISIFDSGTPRERIVVPVEMAFNADLAEPCSHSSTLAR